MSLPRPRRKRSPAQKTEDARIAEAKRDRSPPALRLTSTVCGLIVGSYVAVMVSVGLVLILSLPIAMTHGLAQSSWAGAAQAVIYALGLASGSAILVAVTIVARRVGDHLSRRLGTTPARLVLLAPAALLAADLTIRLAGNV